MKRKLFSTLLCAFALLLLMGAAEVPAQAELVLAQEESVAVADGEMLETDNTIQLEVNGEARAREVQAADEAEADVTAESVEEAVEPAVTTDELVFVDGQPAPIEIGRTQGNGTTYVSLAGMAKALDQSAAAVWDGSTGTVTVTTANLTMTARLGQQYVVANGRYLYLSQPVGQNNGTVMVPLSVVTKAFDAKLTWDAATGKILIQRGSGALMHGDAFYNQDDLFWLSRVMVAEAGNQGLKGQMAVGNVVLNRVLSPIFPDTIHGVLAQKNQFSTYKGGALAKRIPTESCIIAAKLVLDGGVVEEVENALWFDAKCSNSWAARHKAHLATIGGHRFYG